MLLDSRFLTLPSSTYRKSIHTRPIAYAGFWKRGAKNFRKCERNIDEILKLSHLNFVPFFAQNQVKSKKQKVFTQISSHFSPKIRWRAKKKGLPSLLVRVQAQSLMPNLQRGGGGMPQFCSLFYAILQSWRPKGGAMAQWTPPKYAPALDSWFWCRCSSLSSRDTVRNRFYWRNENYLR